MLRARQLAVALVVAGCVLAAGGCENTEPSAAEREAVEGTVTAYLHALAEAYSSIDGSHLEPYATLAEIQEVQKMLRGLAGTGDRVEARLLSTEFNGVDIFRDVNATVTITEVWEVTRFDAFTGHEKGKNPTSIQDSIIQLRLIDGRWMVTARRVIGQETGTRWKIEDGMDLEGGGGS
jgi:hypothetical protein